MLSAFLLTSLWVTSCSGQAVIDTPYITIGKAGDTVVNNLPIEAVKRANEEHVNFIGCQADMDSCEASREDLTALSAKYMLQWKLTDEQRANLAQEKTNMDKALKDSQANSDAFEKRLNRMIKFRNFVIPFGVATLITGGALLYVAGHH
jgi:hypothetical protein